MSDEKTEQQDRTGKKADEGDLAPVQPDIVRQLPVETRSESMHINTKATKRTFISAGERIHNEITYRGVDWLLNSAIGVAVAYWANRTHMGRHYFSEPIEGVYRSLFKPFLKHEGHLEEGVSRANWITNIMVGGTLTIPPIMMLEDHNNKKGIVRFFDDLVYGKETVDNDPKFARAYHEIDRQPRKDFWMGFFTRIISLAPIFGVTVSSKTHPFLDRTIYEPIAKSTKWAGQKIGFKPENMARVQPDKTYGNISDWDYLHKTIGFDFGLTVFYSIMHEITYKTFSHMFSKPEEAPAPQRAPDPTLLLPATGAVNADKEADSQPGSQVNHVSREEHVANVRQIEGLIGAQ